MARGRGMEEEGREFKWFRPPPDPGQYWELWRNSFVDFDRRVCQPKSHGHFRLHTSFGESSNPANTSDYFGVKLETKSGGALPPLVQRAWDHPAPLRQGSGQDEQHLEAKDEDEVYIDDADVNEYGRSEEPQEGRRKSGKRREDAVVVVEESSSVRRTRGSGEGEESSGAASSSRSGQTPSAAGDNSVARQPVVALPTFDVTEDDLEIYSALEAQVVGRAATTGASTSTSSSVSKRKEVPQKQEQNKWMMIAAAGEQEEEDPSHFGRANAENSLKSKRPRQEQGRLINVSRQQRIDEYEGFIDDDFVDQEEEIERAPERNAPAKEKQIETVTAVTVPSPRKLGLIEKERLLKEASEVVESGAPKGSMDVSSSFAVFAKFRNELLAEGEEAVAWGILYRDGSSNFRQLKEEKERTEDSEEADEEADDDTATSKTKPKRKERSPSSRRLKRRLSFQQKEKDNVVGLGFEINAKLYFLPLNRDHATGGGTQQQQQRASGNRTISERFNLRSRNNSREPAAVEAVSSEQRWQLIREFIVMERSKVCYNLQQLLRSLYVCNPSLRSDRCVNSSDPKLAAWLLHPTNDKKILYKYDTLVGKYAPEGTSQSPSSNIQFCTDLARVRLVARGLEAALDKAKLTAPFTDQEMRLPSILADMELEGVGMDVAHLTKHKEELNQRAELLAHRAAEWAGHPFLLSSPVQIAKVLFDELQLPKPPAPPAYGKNRTPKKHATTSEATLHSLADRHPLPNIILEYRHLKKLITTYIDPFVQLAFVEEEAKPTDSRSENVERRIHCRWYQMTATGRLASVKPNMQNLPRPESLEFFRDGQEVTITMNIRDAFVSRKGHFFLSADYSQLEMRILAHICKDAMLLQFFHQGQDIFKLIASRLWNKSIDEVEPKERELAKGICYGILYGKGAASVAKDVGVSEGKAKDFIDKFMAKFPQIRTFIEETKQQAYASGNVRTLLNRWRLLPEIRSSNAGDRAYAERQAVNTKIQGTASDLVKQAMIHIDEKLRERSVGSKLLLQIHDELVYEVPEEELDEMAELVRSGMEEVQRLDIALPVSVKFGKRIGSLETYQFRRDQETAGARPPPSALQREARTEAPTPSAAQSAKEIGSRRLLAASGSSSSFVKPMKVEVKTEKDVETGAKRGVAAAKPKSGEDGLPSQSSLSQFEEEVDLDLSLGPELDELGIAQTPREEDFEGEEDEELVHIGEEEALLADQMLQHAAEQDALHGGTAGVQGGNASDSGQDLSELEFAAMEEEMREDLGL